MTIIGTKEYLLAYPFNAEETVAEFTRRVSNVFYLICVLKLCSISESAVFVSSHELASVSASEGRHK